MPRSILAAAALLTLASCTVSGRDLPSAGELNVAGGPAGSGGVCAYYSGTLNSGRTSSNAGFARRACFSSLAQCRQWFSGAQFRYPNRRFSKTCR